MQPMEYKKGITVYGASRNNLDPVFTDAARELGRLIALEGYPLISGGGRNGLMAAAIDGANTAGGMTIGILPEFMVSKGWQHEGLTTMITTPDMHRRKELMAEMSVGVIAMPGGIGTFEELLEIITWRQLGLYRGPVVILNTDGYYDLLLGMLESASAKGFMRATEIRELWHVVGEPEHAVKAITSRIK